MHHNEGAAGAERLVSLAFADGEVRDFTGERSAEKLWAILSFFPPSGTLYHFLSLCPQHRCGGQKVGQIPGFAITGARPACADACRRSSALGRSYQTAAQDQVR